MRGGRRLRRIGGLLAELGFEFSDAGSQKANLLRLPLDERDDFGRTAQRKLQVILWVAHPCEPKCYPNRRSRLYRPVNDYVEAAAGRCTELRFLLNPGADVCVANARKRPWEPGYCESPEQQQQLLGPLIEFIRAYEHVADDYGLRDIGRSSRRTPAPRREYTQQDADT